MCQQQGHTLPTVGLACLLSGVSVGVSLAKSPDRPRQKQAGRPEASKAKTTREATPEH